MTRPSDSMPVQILALGAELQKVRDQLGDLAGIGTQVTDLADNLAALQEQVDALDTAEQEQPVRMWDWTAMNQEQATVAWRTLIEWVDLVLVKGYRVVGDRGARRKPIPMCWYRHEDAVAELSWLCQEWHRLYRSSKGTPAGAGEWHDRWLPGVIKRLREDATSAECVNGGQHREQKPGPGIDDEGALLAVIEADITNRPPAPPPA